MAMIPYHELVAALAGWRARKGLPVEQRAEYLSAAPAAGLPQAPPRAMPIASAPARAAAVAAAPAAYGTLDDDPIDGDDLDVVAEEDEQVGDSTDMLERARTAATAMDDENTAIAGGFPDEDSGYAVETGGTLDVDDDGVMDEEIASGELDGGGPPPLAPPPGEDDDDNPWK